MTITTAIGDVMPPKELLTLPAGLKAVREQAGLTQQDLATKAGVSVSVVFQTEQGQKKDMKLSTIVALADAVGMEASQLVAALLQERPAKKPRARKGK
jgi:transcriptional regulator with XRE-family HTH domain